MFGFFKKRREAFDRLVIRAVRDLQGQAYGSKIYSHIANATNTDPSLGRIYSTLGRLEKGGYLTKEMITIDAVSPPRFIWIDTDKAQEKLPLAA